MCVSISMFAATIPLIPEQKLRPSEDRSSYNVLTTMKGYIANFFTCQDCKEHFALMAVEIDQMKDKTNMASVLWLWNAHNRVKYLISKIDDIMR